MGDAAAATAAAADDDDIMILLILHQPQWHICWWDSIHNWPYLFCYYGWMFPKEKYQTFVHFK